MLVRFTADGNASVFMLGNVDGYTRDLFVPGQKIPGKPKAEGLDLFYSFRLRGECVDGVFHSVGRQAFAVVALDVDIVEIAFECDLNGYVLQLMPSAAT